MSTEAKQIDISATIEEMRTVGKAHRMEFFMLNPQECAAIVAKLDEQAKRIAELEAKTVWFVGVNPIDPTGGAIPPMVPGSWRFGFKNDGDNQGCAMRFGFFDDGPFVAWDAVKDQVAFAECAKPDEGRFSTEEEGDAYMHGFYEGEERAKARIAELESAMAWRPMESAPKDGTHVLVQPKDGLSFVASFDPDGYWYSTPVDMKGNCYMTHRPVGWLPIPEFKGQGNG